jgi:predicted O-methyltransferase YrrM
VNAAEEYRHRLGIWTDSQAHLEFLHETVLAYSRPAVIELGVAHGNTTSALLAACGQGSGLLYSCDVRMPHVPASWCADPHWSLFIGDDLSAEALEFMPAQCDVLFVDSDHSYEHVLRTMELYMPRVKPGGIALFHDTQWVPGDVDLGRPEGRVAHAISAYCESHRLSWENRPGSYGLGVVRQPVTSPKS